MSLIQMLNNQETLYRENDVREAKALDTGAIYASLYEKHFGIKITYYQLKSDRTQKSLNKVDDLCFERSIDTQIYIDAQMVGIKKWLKGRTDRKGKPLKFQPTMLLGDKAMTRYIYHVKSLRRKFNHISAEMTTTATKAGAFLNGITAGYESVGAYYVAAALTDQRVTWGEAVENVKPGVEWIACDTQKGIRWRHLMVAHGVERMRLLVKLASLRGAVAVVTQYRYDLAERMDLFGVCNWEMIAENICKLYIGRIRVNDGNDLSAVSGQLWGYSNNI